MRSTKERLFELVFPGEADVQYEAIEVVVYRLRKKLAGTGADADDAARPGLPAAGRRERDTPRGRRRCARDAAAGHPAAGRRCSSRSTPSACTGRRLAAAAHRLRPHAAGLGQDHRRAAGRDGYDDAAALRATVPYSALEAFEADNQSRMFYRVSTLHGELVSGFADLPVLARPHSRSGRPTRRWWTSTTTTSAARTVRVAVLLQPVASARGPRHGRGPGGRNAGAARDAGAQILSTRCGARRCWWP